ncbi:hypothetical protein ARMGADRAFT_1032815 [Armillaria gallica]|uniref:Uncharacterized protein n=1 Tax=Armillaria gallica TaxID=47427 RepID=A0A2H3D4V3_ARMGA|nr:hypothetical protein ARMGADRAFT_1032815 [Armillaria gallica]
MKMRTKWSPSIQCAKHGERLLFPEKDKRSQFLTFQDAPSADALTVDTATSWSYIQNCLVTDPERVLGGTPFKDSRVSRVTTVNRVDTNRVRCAAVAMSGKSTSDAAMPSTFLKQLYDNCCTTFNFLSLFASDTFPRFDVRIRTASLVSFIPRAANRQLVCRPVGNTSVAAPNINGYCSFCREAMRGPNYLQ